MSETQTEKVRRPGQDGKAKYELNLRWRCPVCDRVNHHNLSYGARDEYDMIARKETRMCENWNCCADYVLGDQFEKTS
jgi:hypothetical protein